ncbi:LamG-like jellyroll fold domain-containing protein [Actinophytocola glycyrrhizae]|uniref:LamG-like jellyroll fold domain-containing protein n=1 Tax=Actinophytocola glycyrrhizae TaxID=2044873 RepID=A0ABV9RRD3_9PSEU
MTTTEDGVLAPKATSVPVEFSGGGRTPLARFADGGAEMVLSWPSELPEPTVEGATATYPEVLPGVDVQVRATDMGFGHDIVVKTPEAAANPALARITLGLTTSRLRLSADKAGNLAGVDDTGTEILHAPHPLMWDTPEDGGPVTERRVGVEIGADSMTLLPDLAFLRDPGTRFPVVIDPTYSRHAPAAGGSWTLVRREWPTRSHWNLQPRDADERDFGVSRVGRAPGEVSAFLDRSYFKFDTARLAGSEIKSATFRIWQVWKYDHSCTASAIDPMVVSQTGNITSATTWNSGQPGAGNVQGSVRSVPKAGHCPLDWVSQNVTAGAQVVADARAAAMVVGLRATDETGVAGWKRFYVQNSRYPYMEITYNRAPAISAIGVDPTLVACKWCGGVPYVGATTLNLRGTVADPDGGQVTAQWSINRPNTVTASKTLSAGSKFTTPLNTATIADGTSVTWSMRGTDGELATSYGGGPRFVVDRKAPARAPKVSSLLYKEDNRWHGGVGTAGTFTFAPDLVPDDPATSVDEAEFNDVDHYLWGWQDPPATKVDASGGLGGTATVRLTPPGDGPRTLFVRSKDRAGNPSPVKAYRFYVRAGNGPLAQWSLEGNTQDTAFLGDRHGTLNGTASYGQGAVGNGMHFTRGSVSAPSAVDPGTSFSVSAWVRVGAVVQAHTAVSQSGQQTSAFQLGYHATDGGKWFFMMPRSDEANPVLDRVWSAETATTTDWTHLAGVFDAQTNELRLYVNGQFSAAVPHTGESFPAGDVRMGNALWAGVLQNHWLGAVDEVQLYDRVVPDAEIRAAVVGSNVQLAHWKFDEAVETTGLPGDTARNVVEGGDMAVLSGGATFTADGTDGSGAVAFTGEPGGVTTNRATIPTDQSFSVAAWAWLPQDAGNQDDGDLAVISQDGEQACAFCLEFEKASGKWVFSIPTADQQSPSGYHVVRSAEPAKKGDWTHLVATYNAATDEMALYVDSEAPVAASGATSWHGSGALQIGQAKVGGAASHFYRGRIDEARAYGRVIGQDEVLGLVGSTKVTAGEWRLDGDVRDWSGNDNRGVVEGQVDWTAGQTSSPDPADRALRLADAAGHVRAGTVVVTNQSFSIRVWARADKTGQAGVVVSQDGSRRSAVRVGTTASGLWSFAMPQSQTDNAVVDHAVGGTVQLGVWTHLAAVYSKDKGRLELYVNGVLAGSVAHDAEAAESGDLMIGRGQVAGAGADYFVGAVDDVAVYSRPLSAAEIRTMAGRDLSLVHNWQLDESSGAAAADSVGTRGGTVTGGATFGQGRVGNSVQLNGTTAAVATTGTDLRTDKSFTVAAWVWLDNPDTDATAVSVNGTNTSRFRLGYLAGSRGTPGFWVFEMPTADGGGAPVQATLSTSPSELGKWMHLVGAYDSASGMMWLYVDGDRQRDNTFDSPWQASGGLQIGRSLDADVSGRYWSGGVDDVRLYAGALDRERVKALYRSFPTEAPPPELPVADAGEWDFDENAGTVAADSSGRGHHATLEEGVTWVGGREGTAVSVNGTSGYAQTTGPVLDTSKSFSVSTWAYLESVAGDRTVLAQDGAVDSAFQLQYNAAQKRWAVLVPAADPNSPDVVLTATESAWTSDWTHVGAVYDAEANHLRLYVNGALAATRHGVTIGPSSGPFTIGRGRLDGYPSAFFSRGIDDVRAFTTALSDGQMRLLHDDVPAVETHSWRFDDGTAKDYNWRANHATVSTGGSFGAGISGQALVLDGTSGAAATAASGIGIQDSFTVQAWAKLTRGDQVATVFGRDGSRMSGFVLQYRPESGRWVFGARTQDADGAPLSSAVSNQTAVLNQWVHLTGTYDQPGQQLRLYVNGTLAGSHTQSALWTATGPFTIGRSKVNGVAAEFFPGMIDEVRVDQGLVTEDEIARRAGWPKPYPGTLGSFVNMAGDHYTALTDTTPRPGYHFERTLGVPAVSSEGEDEASTRMLYSCQDGADIFTSTDVACGGQPLLGEVGLVYITPPTHVATVPVHRCDTGTDRYDSRIGCGSATQEELLGYTAAYAPLRRYVAYHSDHWTSIDGTTPGYRAEGRMGWVPLTAEPGTVLLMSCRTEVDEFTSVDPNCEGKQILGPTGYLYETAQPDLGTAPLYRCRLGTELTTEQFTSVAELCEGRVVDRLLGHALAESPVPLVGQS